MTDNDIIKAFECCSANRVTECGRCPYCGKGCLDKAHADAIDLINRQKAEIERLTEENKEVNSNWRKLKTSYDELDVELKAEIERLQHLLNEAEAEQITLSKQCYKSGIKEFAERLKAEVDGWYYDFAKFDDTMDALMEIANLVKEFTEGKTDE